MIRDAAVLMALNAALEPDGVLNLPYRVVHRHPDFIAIMTTNRGYHGIRPLNEALRDRMQHSEKMDIPPKEVMMERGKLKTDCKDKRVLSLLAQSILTLDEAAKANGIKGVAGMRSYFYWLDAVTSGQKIMESIYPKVLYKITTDPYEINILLAALAERKLTEKLEELSLLQEENNFNGKESIAIKTSKGSYEKGQKKTNSAALALHKTTENPKTETMPLKETTQSITTQSSGGGQAIYHELKKFLPLEDSNKQKRKKLNQEVRESVKGSLHENIKLVVHQVEVTEKERKAYQKEVAALKPIIAQLLQKTEPLLNYEKTEEQVQNKTFGTKFHGENIVHQDLNYFSYKRPPHKKPTLAVALRIDESASMSAFGRLKAAKQAAIALYEFCKQMEIPIMIYGDTANRSKLEEMSFYAYVSFDTSTKDQGASLMTMKARSNNRDGMALKVISNQLLKMPQETKLLISLSDGQPKALPDYSGEKAISDMKEIIVSYQSQGITYLAAAIGQDKETIREIYGGENTLDITDLKDLPRRLVQIIANYL